MRHMRYTFQAFILISLVISAFFLGSCKKKNNFSTGNLDFSRDTVVFDTVFTTLGSTTQRLKLYNNSKGTINIEEIQLMGGSSSEFRINVDGLIGTDFTNLEIEKGDSLFVFVEVTLNVNNGLLPMIVEDQIRFKTNGTDQFVHLAVWGQDAYFHYKDLNSGTWPNDKPHVIYDYAGIDDCETLNIQAGTQIYLHKDALIFNYKGTLNMNGTADNKIVLQGDRLEQFYLDQSGQYYGIYMQEAKPSVIEHVEIKNGTAGIHMFSKAPGFTEPTLTLSNSEIYNNSRYGVFIYAGAEVKAENCLIYKNETHALFVLEGGDFDFNHCHLLGYAATTQVPAVGINNYYRPDQLTPFTIGNINLGRITNCVITGGQTTEIVVDTYNPDGTAILNFEFETNLITSEDGPTDPLFSSTNIWNEDPLFIDVSESDFKFSSGSPLVDAANPMYPTFFDFGGSTRGFDLDIGAWELF